MILSDALIIPISQLQTQHVMTSQIRSHIVEIDEKSSLNCWV